MRRIFFAACLLPLTLFSIPLRADAAEPGPASASAPAAPAPTAVCSAFER